MPINKFLAIELPNQTNELFKAENYFNNIKFKFNKIQNIGLINDTLHEYLYDETIRVLNYVGNLSQELFKINDKLEDMYVLKYIKTPQLGKKLWLDHTKKIHHDYDILKNRCFRLLNEIDDEYFKQYKKPPPNWKI